MLCERARNLFSDYCEGAMPPALVVAFENHLNVCEACRAEVEGVREVYAVLDSAPIVEPPADFRLRVWEKIDALSAEPAPRLRRRWSLDWRTALMPRKLAMGLAAAVALLFLGFVAPGRYTQAGFFYPWSLFTRQAPAVDLQRSPVIDRLPGGAPALSLTFVRHRAQGATFDAVVRDHTGIVARRSGIELPTGAPVMVQLPLERTDFRGTPVLTLRRSDTHAVVLQKPLQTLSAP